MMWQVLDALAAADGDERLEGFDFARLLSRAEAQLEELGRHRLEAAVQTFGS